MLIIGLAMNIDWSKYRNLIFDLDGTLVDSSAGVIAATNYALGRLGQPPRMPKEITGYIGYPLEEMFTAFCDAPLEKLKAAFQRKARECMVASTVPLPGAEETLRLLKDRGYRLAIATTKFTQHTTGMMKKLGWERYFTVLASGDEVERVKPAPDLVNLALTRLGVGSQEAVMIGDTINDVLAARAAGLKVIAVRSPFGNHDLQAYKPDLIIDNVSAIRKVLNL